MIYLGLMEEKIGVELNQAQVVGGVGADEWVEVENREVKLSSGKSVWLSLVVVVSNSKQYADVTTGAKQVVGRVRELVSEMKDGEVAKGLGGLGEKLADFSEMKVSVAGSVVDGRQGWFFVHGGGLVSVYRGGKLGKVLSGLPVGGGLVGGELKLSDVVVITTPGFYEHVPYSRFDWLLSKMELGVERVASELATSLSETRGTAVVLYQVTEKQEQTKAERARGVVGGWFGGWSWGKWFGGRHKKVDADLEQGEDGVVLRSDPKYKRRRRLLGLVFVVLVVVLVGSITWEWRRRVAAARMEEYQELIAPVEGKFEEAMSQRRINDRLARSLLLEARDQLGAMEGVDEEFSEEVEEWRRRVAAAYAEISGEEEIVPELFFDLSLVSEGFVGTDMALDEERLWVWDGNSASLLTVGVATKQSELVASGGLLEGGRVVAASGGRAFVFTGDEVVAVESGEVELIIEDEEVWEEVGLMGAYVGNVYLLDRSLGEIWRYSPVEDGYTRQRWLAPGVAPEFDGVVDLEIDGDVWVLDGNGGLRQYRRGAAAGLPLEELDAPITNAAEVYPTEDNVLVLDKSGNRVVVYTKEGAYQKQWLWSGFGGVSEMVVWNGRVLVLAGSELLEISL